MIEMLTRMRNMLQFFRHVDNWHRLPGLRRALCRIGRHDWECEVTYELWARFICIECGRRKMSASQKTRA